MHFPHAGFRAFSYIWACEGVEIRQNEDRGGLSPADCGLYSLGGLRLPGGGPFLGARPQLRSAAYQAQRRQPDPLPPLPGRKLRAADDRRIRLLRGALQTGTAYRAGLDRLAPGADRRRGFVADDASGQHHAADRRQGAPHGEPAPFDPRRGHGGPAGQEHPQSDRSPGGRRGRYDPVPQHRAAGHDGRAARQTPLFPAAGRSVQSPGGRFEPRDLAARDHRPGHPRRRGEGHHRAGAASLAGQRHEQPAGHLRPCVAGGAAVELQQRTGQYEDIPPDHGLRGRGHGLPDAAYRAQRGFPQAVVAHPGRRSHRGRGADAPVRRDALARHQSQQPLPPRAGARQPRQGVAAGGAREADAGHHARHQGPAGIGDGLYRPACAADGRQAAGTLPAQHERVVGTPAGAGQQSAGFLPAGY